MNEYTTAAKAATIALQELEQKLGQLCITHYKTAGLRFPLAATDLVEEGTITGMEVWYTLTDQASSAEEMSCLSAIEKIWKGLVLEQVYTCAALALHAEPGMVQMVEEGHATIFCLLEEIYQTLEDLD